MDVVDVNYLAVLVAAAASFGFGAVWYMTLSGPWMAAVGMTDQPKPDPRIYALTAACQLVMAWFLAGLIGHLGDVSVARGIAVAISVWLAFVVTTLIVNHRFQGAPWSLTLIDGGHWLGALLVQGIVIGLFGA